MKYKQVNNEQQSILDGTGFDSRSQLKFFVHFSMFSQLFEKLLRN